MNVRDSYQALTPAPAPAVGAAGATQMPGDGGRQTRRRVLSRFGGAATLGVLGMAGALGAAACAQQQSRAPVTLNWYSWGPEYPLAWTLEPGINNRGRFSFGPDGNARVPPGQPTPVPPEQVLQQQIAPLVADRQDLIVKVQTERFDKYSDKLAALATAGQLPDVMTYDGTQATSLVRAGVLYNLNKLQGGQTRSFIQNYAPGYIDASTYRGKLYGVPYQARQLVLFVNKSVFGSISLPPETWGDPSWTWTAFLEKAASLTQRTITGGYRQFGTLFTGRPMWAAAIRQNAAVEFNKELSHAQYDSPEAIEAIQWMADLVNKFHVAPNERQNPKGQSYTFDLGNVGMYFGYQHTIPLLNQRIRDFTWDIYPLPSSRRPATYADWGYLSISANTVDVDRSWELIRFLNSLEGDVVGLKDGVSAPILKGTEPGYMVGSSTVKNKAAAVQATQQVFGYRPIHEAWDKISSLLDFYLQPVFNGDQKASSACRDLRPVIDGVLADLQSSKSGPIGDASQAGGDAAAGGDASG